eukprot:2445423-Rhodomonas_salina.1
MSGTYIRVSHAFTTRCPALPCVMLAVPRYGHASYALSRTDAAVLTEVVLRDVRYWPRVGCDAPAMRCPVLRWACYRVQKRLRGEEER